METLFKAAKAGNLQQLLKFKNEGIDLCSKDENGNSVFLWAACSGHLDVIKWLLNEKIAHIDEQNKAGNTALILAAAYGHTQICKVLLDSNSNINVENNLKSTALSIALSHNHLAVVDLLIRSSELTLTQSSRTHSSHSALNYYTKIVELFSQNEVDYTQILLVIKNASTQINNTELSFIYLIYHWLDINYLTRNPLPGTPQNFFADKLTIPHQAELMSHMLRTGIILTNLNQRIIYLNEEQKKSVHYWLNKSEEDSYLASRTLEAERTAVYNEFYLKLIYSALVHARGVDDSKPVNGTFLSVNLEKAIATPYSYHSDVANNVLINVDAAQWTAYHLCREGQLSVEQHSRPYKLTKGLSRRAYYNRLMLCIDNNNPNKNILLNELGDIPDINGERLRWSHNYSSWLQNISKKLSKPNTAASNGTLKLIGCDSIIHLNNGLISQMWNSQKHETQPTKLEGNHPVYHLKSQSIYCKLYPGLPGINDALHYLYRRLFSSVGGLPWSVTGLLKVDGHVIPVLLSEDSGEKLTNNDKRLDKLNTYELSKLILFSMITNPEDGKCDNYTAKQNADGTYSIFSVDNDQGLVNATVESSTLFFFTSKKLSVKTVLFCLDLMNKQLDPRAIAEFRALNSIEIVKGWLDDLVKLESEYETLFKGFRKNFAQETNPLRRVYSYVLMPIATVMNLVFKIQAIQAALKKHTSITPLFLLSTIEPSAARYYQQVLEKKMSPTARFDELVINEKLYGYNEVTKTYSTTLTSAKELFESLVPSKQASSVSPQVALELFTRAVREWQLITEVLTKVLNGDIKQLTSLPIEEQQKLIKLIQFNQLDRENSKSLLGYLAYQEKLTEVYLHRTEKDLLNWHLSYLLKNNKLLTKLSLNNASALTTLDSLGDAQKLNYLRLINLPNLKKLKANLPNVTEIILKDLPILTSIDITAPKLKRLSITNCPELKLLNLSKIPVLDHLSFVKCNQLPLADFYNNWPRFISQWDGVPHQVRYMLAQKLNKITQGFDNSLFEYKDYFYDGVRRYIAELKLIWQRDIECIWSYQEVGNKFLEYAIIIKDFRFPCDRGRKFFSQALQHEDWAVRRDVFCALALKVLAGNRNYRAYVNLFFKEFSAFDASRMEYIDLFISSIIDHSTTRISEFTPEDQQAIAELLKTLQKKPTLKDLCSFLTHYVREECIVLELSIEGHGLARFINNLVRNVFLEDKKNISPHFLNRILCAFALNIYAKTHNLNPRQFSSLCRGELELYRSNSEYTFAQCVDLFAQERINYHYVEKRKLTWEENEFIRYLNYMILISPNESHLADILLKHVQGICLPELYSQFALLTSESYKPKNRVETSPKIKPSPLEEQSKISLSSDSNNCQKINGEDNPLLLSAVEQGDLTVIKTLLKTKNISLTSDRNILNTMLSLAVTKDYFPIVDYLIKHYYVGSTFSEQEKRALNICQNEKIIAYLHLFYLCSQEPLDNKIISVVLKETQSTNRSDLYSLYFWMHIHYQANSHLSHGVSLKDEPSMHELLPEHQSELILHMIREGYVLKDWYINSNELTITDMLIDKKQVDALEQLLQQGQYQFCLKAENQPVEEGKIYFNVDLDGLHYTVQDNAQQIRTGVIPATDLTDALIPPLTLDQLQNVSGLLEQIAPEVALRPTLKQLNMNHVRFTKQYQLRAKKNHIYENVIYFETAGNAVKYTVIAPSGKKIINKFSVDELKQLGWAPQFTEMTFLKLIDTKEFKLFLKQHLFKNYYIIEKIQDMLIYSLSPIRSALLKAMAQRGHIMAETDTMGFTSFMSLLEHPFIASNLERLNLDDCDLFEDFDLDALDTVLPKCTKLIHLNLDNNHIRYDGFKKLYRSLAPLNRLASLSLRFNEIAIELASDINALVRRESLREILITGNHCVAGEGFVKLNHKKRVVALQHLFELALSIKENLTLEEFLNTAHIQLQKTNNTNVLTMTLGALNDVSVALDDKACTSFNDLINQITKCGKQRALPDSTPQGIFAHLISGLRVLINTNNAPFVNDPISSNESFCKKVLHYHTDAPIKGLLNRSRFFKTERIESCASYLFPEQQITMKTPESAGQGFVYLIANDRKFISVTEHALLGYEYLTSNGQHIFKVAHLQNSGDITTIKFIESDLTTLRSWLPKHRLIAPYKVDSHRLKQMHQSILEDREYTNLPEINYSSCINRSSRDEKESNCLTYCLKKMSDYLNIHIELHLIDWRPSAVVRTCIDIIAQEEQANGLANR